MRPPRLALRSGSTPVEVSSFTCRGLQDVEPQSLGVTYWFDAAPDGAPYTIRVHISGRLRGEPEPGRQETFAVLAEVAAVVPGSGRIAVTTRVPDLPHGTWDVTAIPVQQAPKGSSAEWMSVTDPRLPSGTACGTTALGPVVRVLAPGVRLGAWPALVGTGTALALVIQSLLAQRLGLAVQRLLPLSLVTCLLGLLGAKVYFLATHPRERRTLLTPGMSIQGFVLVAVATLLGGSLLLGLPPGPVLDSTAPGLLFGMMVGRFGCLLGGCCAGRPTSSRWGVWSSDRRLGVRRIPVQLLESLLSGVVGVLALAAVLLVGTSAGGLAFVAGFAAYTAGRQLLFPLRGIPRTTAHGPMVMLGSALFVAMAATATLLLR
ncbi:MAG: prolipoprotein diacylglyceryl transferase family protein [Dermatophilaceae bacterium]